MLTWKMALRGLKIRKGETALLFLLIGLVSLFTITAANILLSGERIWDASAKEQNSPSLLIYVPDDSPDKDIYLQFFKNRPEVTAVELRSLFFVSFDECEWPRQGGCSFVAYPDSSMKPGEILAPYAQVAQGSAAIGDVVKLTFTGGHKKSLTVVGSYVDPLFGSPITNNYHLPISPSDYREIVKWNHDLEFIQLEIHVTEGTDLVKLFKAFPYSPGADMVDQLRSTALIVPNMVSYVLIGVAMILILAALLALRHGIISAVESDYKSIGTLKAVGMESKQVLSYVLLQYFGLAFAAATIGAVISVAIQRAALHFFLAFAGLAPQVYVFGWLIAGVVVGICAVALLTAWLSARRVYTVSPVRAISLGQAPVHFTRRVNVSMRKLFLPRGARLAVKQTVSRSNQLVVVLTISAIFTYIMTALLGFHNAMLNERSAAKMFAAPIGDISFFTLFHQDGVPMLSASTVVNAIDKLSAVDQTYELMEWKVKAEGFQIVATGISDFGKADMPDPLSGRYPKYANEVAITPQIRAMLGVDIGGVLSIQLDQESRDFIVVGTVSSADQMGVRVFILGEGYNRFSDKPFEWADHVVVLKDAGDIDHLVDQLNRQFKDQAMFMNMKRTMDVAGDVRLGLLGVTLLVGLVAVLLILLTTMLIAQIAIGRERADMVTLRATGYSVRQLRRQFTTRFMLISLVGSLIGTLLALALADKMLSAIFSIAGVSRVITDKSALTLAIPIVLICGCTTLFSWLSARSIRKIDVQSLAVE